MLPRPPRFTLFPYTTLFRSELTSEEAVLVFGKYHLQKKQTDTGHDDEELMASLGLVEGDSRAGQGSQSKHVTMQDQATSPIMMMITSLILLIIGKRSKIHAQRLWPFLHTFMQ